jgi:hypothetical protein
MRSQSRLVHVVGGEEDGEVAPRLDALEHLPHRHPGHGVEAGGRLVEEEGLRLMHEAPRDLHPAAHAPGQVPHRFVRPLGELDRLQQLRDQPAPPFGRDAVELGEDEEILLDAELEVAGHGLGDDPDRAAHAVGLLADVEAVHPGGALGRGDEGREHPDEGGLSGAVGSEEAEDLPLLHREADPLDRGEGAEPLGQVLDVDRLHRRPAPPDSGKST